MNKRTLFNLLALAGLLAGATGLLDAAMAPVDNAFFSGGREFADQAVRIAAGHFITLSVIKGTLAVAANTQLDLSIGAGILLPVGQLFAAVKDLVDIVWTAFGYALALVWAQKILLGFFGQVSLVWVFSIGCGLYLLGEALWLPLKKQGAALALLGLATAVGAPATTAVSGRLYAWAQTRTDADYAATARAFKNSLQGIDIIDRRNLDPDQFKHTLLRIQESLNQTGFVLASATTRYLSRLVIFLFLSPFLFYGLLYVGYRRLSAAPAPAGSEEKTWLEILLKKKNNRNRGTEENRDDTEADKGP